MKDESLASQLPTAEEFEYAELQHKIREVSNQLRKQMNDLTMRMFLRTTVCFKNIGQFTGKDQTKFYGPNYSGNHIAIFECELKAPPQLSLIDHTYNQYIDAYRMNFKNWKIVDIDNFMEGNHFFRETTEEDIWSKNVTNKLGGPAQTWNADKVNSPVFNREVLFPELRKIVTQIDQVDTRSNRIMSPLHKKRDEV